MDPYSRSAPVAQWQSNWRTLAERLPPKSFFEEVSIFMSKQLSHPLDEPQEAPMPPVEQKSASQAVRERDVEERLRRIKRCRTLKPESYQNVMVLASAAMVVLLVGGIILFN